MDERRTAQLVGLALGGLFACSLVLNALAFKNYVSAPSPLRPPDSRPVSSVLALEPTGRAPAPVASSPRLWRAKATVGVREQDQAAILWFKPGS
jgi:hypothetical protein